MLWKRTFDGDNGTDFCRPDVIAVAQPAVSKHRRKVRAFTLTMENDSPVLNLSWTGDGRGLAPSMQTLDASATWFVGSPIMSFARNEMEVFISLAVL